MDEFTDLLTVLSYEPRPVILAGDFNVKMNLPNNPDTSSFSTLISEFDFSPVVPVTVTHQYSNTLDLFVCLFTLFYLPSLFAV